MPQMKSSWDEMLEALACKGASRRGDHDQRGKYRWEAGRGKWIKKTVIRPQYNKNPAGQDIEINRKCFSLQVMIK